MYWQLVRPVGQVRGSPLGHSSPYILYQSLFCSPIIKDHYSIILKLNLGNYMYSNKYAFLFYIFQNHGVMERGLLYTHSVLGKLFWKHFHVGSLFTFDVYKPFLVSLDQQPPRGNLAHTSCGKLHTRDCTKVAQPIDFYFVRVRFSQMFKSFLLYKRCIRM